jgi:predicted dehydrogenase
MNNDHLPVQPQKTSRRDFLASSGKLAAASALAGVSLPWVHATEDNTIRLALIGCGGRGTGAAANALDAPGGPTKLVAMTDLFPNKLNNSYKALSDKYASQMDVPPDRRFLGFDGYKKAIDCLRPGDVVLQCTHAAFRAMHLEYAVEKGVHMFMEKTFAADPGGLKRLLRIGEAADKKNLKIGAGLMCRHSSARQELISKIRDGAMGDIQFIRAYRMDSGSRMGPFPGGQNELMWQLARPYFFLWSSSGLFIELMIHQVDECCWLKDAWPVTAHGVGGRSPGSTDCSQNFDAYSIEYTFADGAKALVTGRYAPNCHSDFATFAHGTKCAAQFSGNIHAPTVQMYKDQRVARENITWRPEKETVDPWQAEWNVLMAAIRNDRKHNETKRAVYSNLAAIIGRAAVHSGQIITWEDALASDYQFFPNVDGLTQESPAPVNADSNGRYPVPVPGAWTEI